MVARVGRSEMVVVHVSKKVALVPGTHPGERRQDMRVSSHFRLHGVIPLQPRIVLREGNPAQTNKLPFKIFGLRGQTVESILEGIAQIIPGGVQHEEEFRLWITLSQCDKLVQ